MVHLLLNTIALDPYRWTPDKRPYFRLPELAPAIAEHGFERLELWQYHLPAGDAAPDALADALRSHGLTCPIAGLYPALHLSGDEGRAERSAMFRLLDASARLGADIVKIFAGRLGSAEVDDATFARSVDFTRAFAAHAAERGLTVAAETHPDTLCDSVEACFRFLDAVDAPDLRLCYQPFEFTDTARAIDDYRALSEHVIHLHLQGRRDDRMSLLRDADVDYRALFEALAQMSFEGYASIEFVKDCVVDHPSAFDLQRVLDNAARDRDFVRQAAAHAGLTLEA